MPSSAPARRPGPAPVIRCGQAGRRLVALTFDDGPSARYTRRILRVLRRHRVKATFFVLGKNAKRYPRLLRQIEGEGHLVASHSWDHPKHLPLSGWREQIARTRAALAAAGVRGSSYYRPPHGILSPKIEALCGELGLTIAMYTLLSSDWQRPGVEPLRRQVVHRLRDGDIVVLHDGGGDRQQTVEALPGIIRGLAAKGLRPVSLETLLAVPGKRRCR